MLPLMFEIHLTLFNRRGIIESSPMSHVQIFVAGNVSSLVPAPAPAPAANAGGFDHCIDLSPNFFQMQWKVGSFPEALHHVSNRLQDSHNAVMRVMYWTRQI